MKPSLLMLCHRIPFPPDKGDKIRSYHLLREVSQDHAVVLGAFVDDESDWRYRQALEAICEAVYLHPLSPRMAKLKSLKGLLDGRPLSLPYYHSTAFSSWVEKSIEKYRPENILAYSSAMAQFVMSDAYRDIHRVMDFVDVDSDKWRQYAAVKSWPTSWIYNREADRLLAYEKQVASSFDQSFFVSRAEAELFNQLVPGLAHPAAYFNNGVDTDYFSVDADVPAVYEDDAPRLVFTGAMDYWPNIEAVVWFAEEVMPVLRHRWRDLRFVIVGSKPAEVVERLARKDGVSVTGRVPDVRPYVRDAWAVVAPLRIARGIQNKVLEGMAMGRPVLATDAALEGIIAEDGRDLLVANDAQDFLRSLELLEDWRRAGAIGQAARRRVIDGYAWHNSLKPVLSALR